MQNYVRLLLGVISSLALSACFVFSDAELPIDPGGDGGQDSDVDSGSTCVGGDPLEGKLPCRPPSSTTSDADGAGQSLTFAIRDVIIDQDPEETGRNPVGLDLDGIDSSLDGESPGVGECSSEGPGATDSEHGIDNVLGRYLWPFLAQSLPFECELSLVHPKGLGTLLFNISKWHFGRDDAQVEVFITPSVLGTHQPEWTQADAAAAIDEWDWEMRETPIDVEGSPVDIELPYAEDPSTGEPPPAPCWKEGLEEFDWFFANPHSRDVLGWKIRVTDAYIADDWLVMRLPSGTSFDLYTDRRSVQVRLVQGYLLAKISEDRTRTETAFAAGRFTVPSIVEVSPSIGFCEPEVFAGAYRQAADLFANPNLYSTLDLEPGEEPPDCVWVEGEGEDATVIDPGAISVGVEFRAVKVSFGGVAPSDAEWEPPNGCDGFPEGIGFPEECVGNASALPYEPPAHCDD